MKRQKIYYQDAEGRIHERSVVSIGDKIISYPGSAFDLVDGNLVPRMGITILEKKTARKTFVAQENRRNLDRETSRVKHGDKRSERNRERVKLIRELHAEGKLGKLSLSELGLLFGVELEG